jgi:hypothetical protein
MGKDEVEAAIGVLEAWGRTVDNWVLICAAIVAFSLAAEVIFSVLHWRNENKLRPLRTEQTRLHNLELVELGNVAEEARRETARLSAEAETARASIAEANARAAEASARAVEAQLALEKFKAPRTLSLEQQAKIIGEMKQFSGTPFVLGVFIEPEAIALLTQVDEILIAAGWVEQEWKASAIVYSREGKPNVGYTTITGLYIQADNSHAADFGQIVVKLASLLSDAGIDAKAEVGRMVPNTNNDAIKILIGQKPR